MLNHTVEDIRNELKKLYANESFVIDKTGQRMIEITNASFIASEDHILRPTNFEYVNREIEWYESQSLNVNDIPPPIPEIWKAVSSKGPMIGLINSNYGWCVYSNKNFDQFSKCVEQLKNDKFSRRACMIYNRPSMQYDYNFQGMSDFMCTYAVQYMIRNNRLDAYVYMRSNDAVFGYNNDYAWQEHVLIKLFETIVGTYPEIQCGEIFWNAASLHVYERHFKFLES